MAVKKTETVDTPDIETAQPDDIGTIYQPEPIEIDIVQGATGAAKGTGGLSEQAQELLFNEEFVEVMLHESTDQNAEDPVFTACNGVTQYFFRGRVQKVRRKFVGILATVGMAGVVCGVVYGFFWVLEVLATTKRILQLPTLNQQGQVT